MREQVESISEAAGADYRIGRVVFVDGTEDIANRPRGMMMAAQAQAATANYGTGFGSDGSLGNAVKLTMRAHVTLRTSR